MVTMFEEDVLVLELATESMFSTDAGCMKPW